MIDESHMTMGQIKGMYNGDRSRKEMLVNYGFRLPSALDNRPLRREEFESHVHQIVYVSATPGDYENEQTETVIESNYSTNRSFGSWGGSTSDYGTDWWPLRWN